MNSFYVTLPGGVKSVYHDNVLSDYVTHLPREVRLNDNWEVALVEFHFTKSWFNVYKDMWLGITDVDGKSERAPEKVTFGKYDIKQLIENINKKLKYFKRFEGDDFDRSKLESYQNHTFDGAIIVSQPALVLDQQRKRIIMVPALAGAKDNKKKLLFPDMDPDLLGMLGLANRIARPRYSLLDGHERTDSQIEFLFNSDVDSIKGLLYAERAFDIERGVHAIYVYSDVAEENFIGDVSAPCLRVCTLPSKDFGDTVNLQFDQPHYIPVSKRSFQSIRITLKDQANEKIRFEFGETLVKLHFRKA